MIFMLTNIDYQIIVDAIATLLMVGFPIMLLFEIAGRLMNIMLDFIGGRKKVNL